MQPTAACRVSNHSLAAWVLLYLQDTRAVVTAATAVTAATSVVLSLSLPPVQESQESHMHMADRAKAEQGGLETGQGTPAPRHPGRQILFLPPSLLVKRGPATG